MYQFKIGIDPKEHDEFVKTHPLCNLLQSSSWAKIKANWDHEIVGVYEDDNLVASSLVLIRKLPLGFTMLYTPRGPILDYENSALVEHFLQGLKQFAKSKRCLFIKMDPGIHYKDYHFFETPEIAVNIPSIMNNIEKCGVIHQGFTVDINDAIQPRFQANVYKDEFDVSKLSKSTRQMLRIAERKKVETSICGEEMLTEFSKLMTATSKRKQVALRNSSYYETLLKTYSQASFIVMAHVNLKELYGDTKTKLDEVLAEIENCPENAKKKLHALMETKDSLIREEKEVKLDLVTYGDFVYIAGALVITFGNTGEILYAGMDEHFKRYMAPYPTWVKAFEECFTRGCISSNMGGIEGDLAGGLAKYKANFNPVINEFIGEFDLPVNKLLYNLSQLAYKFRKILR